MTAPAISAPLPTASAAVSAKAEFAQPLGNRQSDSSGLSQSTFQALLSSASEDGPPGVTQADAASGGDTKGEIGNRNSAAAGRGLTTRVSASVWSAAAGTASGKSQSKKLRTAEMTSAPVLPSCQPESTLPFAISAIRSASERGEESDRQGDTKPEGKPLSPVAAKPPAADVDREEPSGSQNSGSEEEFRCSTPAAAAASNGIVGGAVAFELTLRPREDLPRRASDPELPKMAATKQTERSAAFVASQDESDSAPRVPAKASREIVHSKNPPREELTEREDPGPSTNHAGIRRIEMDASEGAALNQSPSSLHTQSTVAVPSVTSDSSPVRDEPAVNPAVHQTAAPAEPPSPAETGRPQLANSGEIHLEVPGVGGKVDVRVVERAGDVHVSVRTADDRLAGSLREGLPALSSRLEESGFRSDPWRPSFTGDKRVETPATSKPPSQEPQFNDSNRGRQQQSHQQNPRNAGNRSNSKTERNQFAWLFTSIQ